MLAKLFLFSSVAVSGLTLDTLKGHSTKQFPNIFGGGDPAPKPEAKPAPVPAAGAPAPAAVPPALAPGDAATPLPPGTPGAVGAGTPPPVGSEPDIAGALTPDALNPNAKPVPKVAPLAGGAKAAPLAAKQAADAANTAAEAAETAALAAREARNAAIKAAGGEVPEQETASGDKDRDGNTNNEQETAAISEAEAHIVRTEGGQIVAVGGQAVAVGLFGAAFILPVLLTFLTDVGSRGMVSGKAGGSSFAKERPIRKELAWTFVDCFIGIFMALVFFKAFSATLAEIVHVNYKLRTVLIIFALVYFGVLLMIRKAVKQAAYKDSPAVAFTITGCGTYYMAFATLKLGETVQRRFLESKGHGAAGLYWFTDLTLIICFLIVALALMWVVSLMTKVWRLAYQKADDKKSEEEKKLDAREEELAQEAEGDVYALTLSYLISQGIRYMIMGRYPVHHLFFIGGQGKDGHYDVTHSISRNYLTETTEEPIIDLSGVDNLLGLSGAIAKDRTAGQRFLMFCYSLTLTVVAIMFLQPLKTMPAYLTPYLAERFPQLFGQGSSNPDLRKSFTLSALEWLFRVIRCTLTLCVAWSYVLFGEWEFLEVRFEKDELMGWTTLSVAFSFITLLSIEGFSRYMESNLNQVRAGFSDQTVESIAAFKETIQTMVLMGAAFSCAWCWEHCFAMAADVFGAMYNFGNGALFPKILLAVAIPVVVVPLYMHLIRTEILNRKLSGWDSVKDAMEVEKKQEAQRVERAAGSSAVKA